MARASCDEALFLCALIGHQRPGRSETCLPAVFVENDNHSHVIFTQSHYEERLEQLMMHSNASSGSKTVLTVSMQATDLNERLTTGRQIFSMAVGQGKLPHWIESELLGGSVGQQYRWRLGPRDRPSCLSYSSLLPRNSLIWLNLELLDRQCGELRKDGVSGCALISQNEVQQLFEKWNAALQTKDPEQVANLYSRDAILLPTLSDLPRTDHDTIVDYFKHFLEKSPKGSIEQREIIIGCNMLQDAGLYSFNFEDGTTAEARYSFIYMLEDGEWKISHHHSSLQPNG